MQDSNVFYKNVAFSSFLIQPNLTKKGSAGKNLTGRSFCLWHPLWIKNYTCSWMMQDIHLINFQTGATFTIIRRFGV